MKSAPLKLIIERDQEKIVRGAYRRVDFNPLIVPILEYVSVGGDVPSLLGKEGDEFREIAEFLEKGAVNHIQKPFTPEEIKQKLNALLGEREDGEEELDDSDEGLDF